MLNLYLVYNGFVGCGPVRIGVVAHSEERAIELAREVCKKEYDSYGVDFWNKKKLDCELYIQDVSREIAGHSFDE